MKVVRPTGNEPLLRSRYKQNVELVPPPSLGYAFLPLARKVIDVVSL